MKVINVENEFEITLDDIRGLEYDYWEYEPYWLNRIDQINEDDIDGIRLKMHPHEEYSLVFTITRHDVWLNDTPIPITTMDELKALWLMLSGDKLE